MPKLISTNPAKNYQPIGEIEISSLEEVKSKVKAAHKAKQRWNELGLEGRMATLKKAFDLFEKDKEELALLITQEMGKPIQESREDIDFGINYFQSYIEIAKKALAPIVTYENEKEIHEVHHEPYGVAAVIVPWNYPFTNFVWQTCLNLIVGNTIIFKHSEETPLFGKAIEERMVKHLPEDVFNEIYGDGAVGQILIEQDVNLICFTGSSKTGLHIHKMAAERFIPTVMELGGSAPGIVFEDSDIDSILYNIFNNRFSNCGQMCDALKRLIVHESKVDEVFSKLTTKIKKVNIGDPLDEKSDLGPLVSKHQLDLLKDQVKDAVQKGAKVIIGGKEPKDLKGSYFEPTLLTNITKDMRVWQEEVFGPVLPIVTFKTEEEAIHLANDTKYGLGAYIFTKDKTRFSRIANQIESGMISQNSLSYVNVHNPFGGYKMSGKGREHAQFGIHEVTQIKVIASEK